MIGTSINVEVDNQLDDEIIVDSTVTALGGIHSDGSISGPFIVRIQVRRRAVFGCKRCGRSWDNATDLREHVCDAVEGVWDDRGCDGDEVTS